MNSGGGYSTEKSFIPYQFKVKPKSETIADFRRLAKRKEGYLTKMDEDMPEGVTIPEGYKPIKNKEYFEVEAYPKMQKTRDMEKATFENLARTKAGPGRFSAMKEYFDKRKLEEQRDLRHVQRDSEIRKDLLDFDREVLPRI